jgi:hypothetical protein
MMIAQLQTLSAGTANNWHSDLSNFGQPLTGAGQ